jgi:hypothetical protein
MSTYSDLLDRVDRVGRRVDLVVDTHFERARRDAAAMRRTDAADRDAEERERRDKARRWGESCARTQAKYDEQFQRFGEKAPARIADETPKRYRRRMFSALKDKLPDHHDLARVKADELDSDIIDQFEQMLFDAVQREAEQPSGSNVAETVDDPRARREITDDAGVKKVTWAAKESFIKSLNRSGRRVARIIDPVKGRVILGAPFPHTPG